MPLLQRLYQRATCGKTAVVATYAFVVAAYLLVASALAASHFGSNAARYLMRAAATLPVLYFTYLVVRWPQEKRERRLRRGFCPLCGYDLRSSLATCPECGSKQIAAA